MAYRKRVALASALLIWLNENVDSQFAFKKTEIAMKKTHFIFSLAAMLPLALPVGAQRVSAELPYSAEESRSITAAPQRFADASDVRRVRADQRVQRIGAAGNGMLQKEQGNVLAKRQHAATEPQTSRSAARMAEVTGTEIWGNVIYARSWEPEDVLPEYGVYAYTPEAGSNYVYARPVAIDDKLRANGSGTFYDGTYHFMIYDIWSYYEEWDITSWRQVREVEDNSKTFNATDTDYDVVTGLSYGCYYNPATDSYEFAAVDYGTRSKFPRRPCDLYIAIAINSRGEVYGIKWSDSSLYRIDKQTGAETLVGPTGMEVGDYLQSATFDRSNDVMYWACNDVYGESYLCTVDVSTGRATRLAVFADREQLSSLYIPEHPVAGTPAASADLHLDFPKGNLTGSVSFVLPSLTVGGEVLKDVLEYTVSVNGLNVASGKGNPGEKVVKSAEVPAGFALVSVVVSNASGKGVAATQRQWFGPDCPYSVSDVTLSLTGEYSNHAKVTWKAPEGTGIRGGYVDADAIRYDVIRYPDSVTVASQTALTTFEEDLDVNRPGIWWYGVVPTFEDFRGEEVRTANGTSKGIAGVPYFEGFDTKDAFNQFEIVDANNDGCTWTYNNKVHMAQYSASYTSAADDWMLSPEINLYSGRLYKLGFVYKGFDDRKPERLEMAIGQGSDVKVYTAVVPPMTVGNYDRLQHEAIFEVPSDGRYRLGLHAMSDMAAYYLYVDSLAITEYALSDAPVAVENMVVTPSADGLPTAKIRFTAPMKTNAGADLSVVDRIEVSRDGRSIHTFTAVTPGSALECSDTDVPDGEHLYCVTAWTEAGKGAENTCRTFVGQDLPQAPQNVRLTDLGHTLELTWDAPGNTGINGHYVHAETLEYTVYTASVAGILTPYADVKDQRSLIIDDAFADGDQQMVSFVVRARSHAGEGDRAVSNSLIGGRPYSLPFLESFPNGDAPETFWMSQGYNPFRLADNISYNADGGCIGWKSNGFDHEGWMSSGKIALNNAESPSFIYAYYALPGDEMVLKTSVVQHDGTETVVDVLDFSTLDGAEGWRVQRVDLSSFTQQPFILLQLHAEGTDILTPLYLDHLRVEDLMERNLRVSALEVPANVHTEYPAHCYARVENAGTTDVDQFSVRFYVDGEMVGEVAGSDLSAFEGQRCTFDYMPPVTPEGSVVRNICAEVVCDADGNPSDNLSETRSMQVVVPDYPVVTDLRATALSEGGDVRLTWSEPLQESVEMTESFESYYHKDNVLTPWTMVDVEQGQTYTNTKMDAGYSNVEASFWVFNPYVAAVTDDNLENYLPYDGRQCLMAAASQLSTIKYGDRNDDWFISPEVGGEAQTIDFYAKAAKEIYGGGEPFEIHASSTYPEVACFQKISAHVAPGAWTRYEAALPAGTRYFAIRYVGTDDNFMFLVDDIHYATGVMKVEGYRIYCGSELIREVGADVVSVDVPASSADFYVTVLYANGESGCSNPANVETGIHETEADAPEKQWYTTHGRRVSTKDMSKGVYISADGKKMVR